MAKEHQDDTNQAFVQPSPSTLSGRLELIARQFVEGLMMGRHRSPFKGASVEFVEHREYYPGDEIRHIDWRAFGKTGRYYVKEFEDETNLRATLLVDVSGSMKFGRSTVSKLEYATQMAAAIGFLLIKQRDAVGLLTFDHTVQERLKPSSNQSRFRQLIDILASAVAGQETSLADVLLHCLPTFPRRSLLILMSDCFDDIQKIRSVIQQCQHQRHEIVVFQITAPEERTFPFERPTQFRNLEIQDQRLLVDPARIRHEYLQQFSEFQQSLRELANELAFDFMEVSTEQSVTEVLTEWLAKRKKT